MPPSLTLYYFYIYSFFFLAGGVYLSQFFSLESYFLVILFFFILLVSKNLKTLVTLFFLFLFLLGLHIGKKEEFEEQYLTPVFVNCLTISVPYYSENFTWFKCNVFESDYNLLLDKDINVYVPSERRDIYFGSSIGFVGKIKINKNDVNAYPYPDFILVDNSLNFLSWIFKFKNYLVDRYRVSSYYDKTLPLGMALIFGEKGYLKSEKNNFEDAGTLHLLAISGMHVGILVSLILFFFRFNVKAGYKISSIFLSIYPLFVGFQIPVIRASILGIFYFIAKLKGLHASPINLLFFTGSIIILFSPKSLFSISFQLSFFAVLGLILYKNLFINKNLIISGFLVSLIAVLFTAPLVIYYFGKFSLAGIISTPVLIIFLYPYLFLTICNLFTLFSINPLIYLMEVFGLLFLKINKFFADLKIFYTGYNPDIFTLVVYFVILIGLSFLKLRWFLKIILSIFLFLSFLIVSKSKLDNGIVYVFKKKRFPDMVVIMPYGECFYTKETFEIKRLMKKYKCREKYSLLFTDYNKASTDIYFKKLSSGYLLRVNGNKIRVENKNYKVLIHKNTDKGNKQQLELR